MCSKIDPHPLGRDGELQEAKRDTSLSIICVGEWNVSGGAGIRYSAYWHWRATPMKWTNIMTLRRR